MNHCVEFLKGRRSIRIFGKKMPTEAEILQIIDAARYAPSATNLQPWRFLIVKNENIINEMADAVQRKIRSKLEKNMDIPASKLSKYSHSFTFFKDAPTIIVPLYKPYPSTVYSLLFDDEGGVDQNTKLLGIMSVATATQNILLAAHALGLGACWMNGPLCARQALNEILNIRAPWEILALVPIGMPTKIPMAPRRKNFKVITKFLE